jgi:phospholipid/cholesterol/gamma-HCH transport system substrate-binding protein
MRSPRTRLDTRLGTHRARSGRRMATLLTALLSAVLLLSGCSIYDAPLPGGVSTGENPMTVKVLFRDVLDLVPQSTVKVNDVTVGKVKKVELKGYIAQVTVEVPGDLDLPDNARAEIRQTSLLGEKFVQLMPPSEPGSGKLSDNDTIGLDRTGRNPEVEEVFGALSLLLNGGGVGQLKTIVSELNNAFEGRESEVRSVLDQIRSFMGQLDQNKQSIIAALENTSRLAAELKKQDGTIKSALDNVPDTLRSVNRQRDDLVKLLQALNRLSGVGVRVIQASKESTINSLRSLAPVLDGFAKAGENFPKSFQVFLTYPFVDEAIGRDPQVARNLHMGDFTNLSINLDIDLLKLPLPNLPPIPTPACDLAKIITAEVTKQVEALPDLPIGVDKNQLIKDISAAVTGVTCNSSPQAIADAVTTALLKIVGALPAQTLADLCAATPANALCKVLLDPAALEGAITGGGGGVLPPVVGGVTGGNGLLPRAGLSKDYQVPEQVDPFGLAALGLDPGIGTMLLQGVAEVR